MARALSVEHVACAFPELADVVPTGDASANQKRVFSATMSGERLALKLIRIGGLDAPLEAEGIATVIARMEREISILRAGGSRHLPALGRLEPGIREVAGEQVAYFSEEFIDGESLRETLVAGDRLSVPEVACLGCDISCAIERLRVLQKVHRDVKPANIMRRSRTGEYVLIDPGYALDMSGPTLTRVLAIPGTLAYMSPEQTAADLKRTLDFRSDLYSLGVVMYELLTGVHPYRTPTMSDQELVEAIRTVPPVEVSGVAVGFEGIWQPILRLLKKRPHQRFNAVAALRSALAPFKEVAE